MALDKDGNVTWDDANAIFRADGDGAPNIPGIDDGDEHSPMAPEEPELPADPVEGAPETPPEPEQQVEPVQDEPDPDAPPAEAGKKPQRATFRAIREQEHRAAEAERQLAQERAELQREREERAREREQYLAAQQALNPQQKTESRPGIERPYTQQELREMVDPNSAKYDPVLYGQLVAEDAQRRAIASEQRVEGMQIVQRVNRDEDTFRQSTPDYADALTYLEQAERRAWAAAGYTQAEAEQQMRQRADKLIRTTIAGGRNVAQALYDTAVQVYGYKPAGAQAAPEPEVPAAQEPSPEQKVRESVARSKAANGSIGNIQGRAPVSANFDRAAFMAAKEKDLDKMAAANDDFDDDDKFFTSIFGSR